MNIKFSLLAISVGISLFALVGCLQAEKAPLHAGMKAPDFTLLDEQNNLVTLSQLLGKRVALCFYPRNSTRHCVQEMCSLRDGLADLEENNIIVLGITYTSPHANYQFKHAHLLTFPLLSDTHKTVAKAYGAYGGLLRYFVPQRKTFLINEQGIIVAIINDVHLTKHAQQIIDIFSAP